MGSILTFINKVAAEFPDKTISTLAYDYGRKPPKNLRPASNDLSILCFHTDKRDYRPLIASTRPGHVAFRNDVEKWSKICKNLFLWDYLVCYTHNVMPNPNLRVLQPNFKFYLDHNCKGIYAAMNCDRGSDEFGGLRNYLLAKLLWNVNVDVNAVIDDFVSGCYGKAAEPIRRYIDLLHDSMEQAKLPVSIYGRPSEYYASYLSPELIEKYNELFDEAERLSADDSELLLRVQTARLPVMYAQLQLDYGDIQEKQRVAKKFFDVAEHNKLIILGRRRTTPWYKDLVADKLNKQQHRFAEKLAEASGRGQILELTLGKPIPTDEITIEIMEDNSQSDDIQEYIVEGFDGKSWQGLCRGTTIGYRIEQPASDAASSKFDDSSWQTVTLPRPKKKPGDFWAPFTKEEKEKKLGSPSGWYRKQITIPADWTGQSLALQTGKDDSYADDDVDSIVYFNGRRLSNGYSANRDGGLYDAPLLQQPCAAGAWAKPRHFYVPSWLVNPGGKNQIAVWVAATDGPSGIYDDPLVLLAGDKKMDLSGEWKANIPGDVNSPAKISKIRLRCTRTTNTPVIKRFAVYRSSE